MQSKHPVSFPGGKPMLNAVEDCLQSLGVSPAIEQAIPVGGGCINNAFCIVSGTDKFFLKWNDAKKYPGMFEAEAKGLTLLHQAPCVEVPIVLGTGKAGGKTFLLLEWVEGGKRTSDFWSNFGINLAKQHRKTDSVFGLD